MTTPAQASIATAAQTVADGLLSSARTHKRAAAHHRRAAQQDMQALERLRFECARHGIRLVVTATAPKEAEAR